MNFKWTIGKLPRASTSNRKEKKEQMAAYSCCIFILRRQGEYFERL